MGVDLSDLMGGEAAPSDEQIRGTDDNTAESDAGAVDHPQGEKELYEDLGEGGDDTDVDTGDGQKPRKQLVPLAALQEERTKRQEMQQQLLERQAAQDRLSERLARLLEQQQQLANPQPEVEQIPDFDEDPRGHVEGLRRQFEQQLQQLQQVASGQQQNNQQAQQFQMLQQRVSVDESTYRATNPDYDAAAQHFNDRKLAEYTALGMDLVQARGQLARDVQGIAQIAYNTGRNPAEVLHNLAKAFGFNGKPAPGNGGGGDTGAPAAPPKAPNTSLSSLEGAARAPDEKGKITAAQIADMPDKDFDEFFERMGKQARSSNRIKF